MVFIGASRFFLSVQKFYAGAFMVAIFVLLQ
ncbi:hypothetical protein N579_06140 [Corynebacterium pseudodiphtheriticum 090104]|nr:hypothetical protein N579_06140 [Corynebacterium pseudodiphtheriticum 090104]